MDQGHQIVEAHRGGDNASSAVAPAREMRPVDGTGSVEQLWQTAQAQQARQVRQAWQAQQVQQTLQVQQVQQIQQTLQPSQAQPVQQTLQSSQVRLVQSAQQISQTLQGQQVQQAQQAQQTQQAQQSQQSPQYRQAAPTQDRAVRRELNVPSISSAQFDGRVPDSVAFAQPAEAAAFAQSAPSATPVAGPATYAPSSYGQPTYGQSAYAPSAAPAASRPSHQYPGASSAPQSYLPQMRPAEQGKHAQVPQEPKRSALRSVIEFVLMVAIVLGLAWLMHTFLFQAYEIPSGSMEETIMTGDRVISEMITYDFGKPQPGDIVTFEDPETEGRILIKRCIAVAGQVITLTDGKVCVDGVPMDEPYTNGRLSYPLRSQEVSYPYVVPQGHIWVMGDNRTNSQDSRYFGAIPVSSITGKAVAIYWPLSNIGLLN